MAFETKNLSVLAYSNGFTLWHYATVDTAAVVDTNGYFNEAADMLRTGDMVMANVDTDGTPAAGIFLVSSSTGSNVDLADITAVGGTNTD
ncbi:hypothetical protein [Terasakiella sp. SH-1]|uniref:hypothetical protein n=1 Tax=Terasakiella sp. SH-1 TaxID=2560057 RepID=UPI00197F28BA|nr:hypothetical protein [Terasakiella sp. SH-1]